MKRLSLLFGFIFSAGLAFAQDDARMSEAHPSNFRHWSFGLNLGATASLGDAASSPIGSMWGQKGNGIPYEVGGYEFGVQGHLDRWISPTIGLRGTAGYHTTSGSYKATSYFEGDYIDADLSMLLNLSNMFIYGKDYDRKFSVLFGIGLGVSYLEADRFLADGTFTGSAGGSNRDDRAFFMNIPLQLNLKYRLNNSWDLDGIYKHTFATIDGADAHSVPSTGLDMFGYVGFGVSYNFGADEKQSIVYYSPFEGMFADISEMKAGYDKLTTDDDGDGVSNLFDQDNSTPEGVVVGANGAPLDVDGDGVPDYLDADPFTPKGAKVDSEGRTIDSDGDGVGDHIDEEPNTPEGVLVNWKGVSVADAASGGGGGAYMPSVYFSFNSATVTDANYMRLAAIASGMKANPKVKITLTGHSDASGPEEYNKTLGQRRADAAKKVLVQEFGIDEGRIMTDSKGEAMPLASSRNNINRRVDVSVN